jgi:hypothetical protein
MRPGLLTNKNTVSTEMKEEVQRLLLQNRPGGLYLQFDEDDYT